jgi:hypothetical protein
MDAEGKEFPSVKAADQTKKLSGEVFLNRWNDALVHALLTYSCEQAGDSYDPEGPKSDVFRRKPVPTEKLGELPASWAVGYRNVPGSGGLVPELKLARRASTPAAGTAHLRQYFYRPEPNAYQTASGGYTVLLSAQLLRRTLKQLDDAKVTSVGEQYPLKKVSGDGWVLYRRAEGADREVGRIMLAERPRYSGVVLTGPGIVKSRLNVDDVVEEVLNAVTLDLYDSQGRLATDLDSGNSPYGLFAVGKFLVAARHPAVVGCHAWHRDFCARLADRPAGTFSDNYYDLEFAILTALQAYVPAYPSSNASEVQVGSPAKP